MLLACFAFLFTGFVALVVAALTEVPVKEHTMPVEDPIQAAVAKAAEKTWRPEETTHPGVAA